jgi:Ca2+-binding EF-hand superfamily protein
MISGINQASQMSSLLFSRLDTKSQGYIEKTDLAAAFSQIAESGRGQSSASVDDVFSALDGDSDGKVTQDEFSKVLTQLQAQLDSSRTPGGMAGHGGPHGAGGMPPPPPPGGDAGFTKEELASQLEAADGSDSQRTQLMSRVLENFEAADTNSDGKVSFQEAMAYDQSTQTTTASESASQTVNSAASSEAQVMMKIMQLMHAYRNDDSNTTSTAATIATVA